MTYTGWVSPLIARVIIEFTSFRLNHEPLFFQEDVFPGFHRFLTVAGFQPNWNNLKERRWEMQMLRCCIRVGTVQMVST